jgi:two-component system LytT family response regulator
MKAVIVEDEGLAARNLQTILEEIGTVDVIAKLEGVSETVEWFESNQQPDILFLDIHLADGSAFEIFDRIKVRCPIIFTTAYDEYALKAFKVNSIDYLLKPVDVRAVHQALEKLKSLSFGNDAINDIQNLIASFKMTSGYKTHFLIPSKGDKLIPVQADEIAYFYIDTSMIKARTFSDKTYMFEFTLDEIANMLNPSDFFRANRQFIISRSSIKDLDFWFNSRLSVNLKVEVPEKILISKARVPEFKNWFGGNH